MRQGGWLLAALVVTAIQAYAEVSLPSESPYQIIVVRNPFGLKDPPPVVPPAPTNPPPVKSTVQLVGISVSPFGKYAYLSLPVGPGRTNAENLRLAADGAMEQSGIRVLEIDERMRRVRIRNSGTEETLDFTNNSAALTTATLVGGGPPGAPGVVGGVVRPGVPTPATFNRPGSAPAVVPGGAAGAAGAGATSSGVIRSGYTPGSAGQATITTRGASGESVVHAVPGRPLRTQPVTPDQPAIDPLVQRQVMEEQKRAAEDQGIPFPPMPPE